jgi:DNA helicase IV
VYEFGLTYESDVYTSESIDQLPERTVRWSRLFDIKGREFPVIILIDLPDLASEAGRAQAYVASTRATSLLFILGEDPELSQWRALFPRPKSGMG